MARYIGPKCRRCRKEEMPLFLKGERCETPKCPVIKKKGIPGMHKRLLKKVTEYAVQLRAKQQVKRVYGIMERQFRRYFKNAEKQKGITGLNLLMSMELRIDNIVRKMGIASSLPAARQMVLHGHIKVNDKIVSIPSYRVKVNDKIKLVDNMKENVFAKKSIEVSSKKGIVPWLAFDIPSLTGTVTREPIRDEMSIPYNEERPIEQLIVELYSK